MGRDKTGAWTCEESKRVELSYLLKQGYLRKGAITKGSYYWTIRGSDSGNITIVSAWLKDEIYVRLLYRFGSGEDAKKYDTRVDIVTVPSNLGKGEVMYFLCPATNKRCRVLYNAYGFHGFVSREAYSHRLYYSTQIASKRQYAIERAHRLEDELEKIYNSSRRGYYAGKKTRTLKRVERMESDLEYFDGLNLESMAAMMGISLDEFLGVDEMKRDGIID